MSNSLSSRRRALLLLGIAPLAAGSLGALLLQACKAETSDRTKERQQALRDVVSVVIVPTYTDLAMQTQDLVNAAEALQAGPSASTLGAAQGAFKKARSSWKQSEAFYFGPADEISYTGGAIDSWPADAARLDALIAGDAAIDVQAAGKLGANLRGFPGLEYLLFDSSAGDDAVLATLTDDALGPRRLELTVSLAKDLADKCENVRAAWADSVEGGPGYGHELAEAGVDSSFYARQRDGIDDVITGMLYVAELMVMNKFAKPLGDDSDGKIHPELEEAPRSDGTLDDLRDNVRGLSAVYLCKRGDEQGYSLSDEVKAANGDVDKRFKQSLDDALAALDAVPGSFREALVTDPAPIQAAYDKARDLKNEISMELAGVLGASIGFGYSDTD